MYTEPIVRLIWNRLSGQFEKCILCLLKSANKTCNMLIFLISIRNLIFDLKKLTCKLYIAKCKLVYFVSYLVSPCALRQIRKIGEEDEELRAVSGNELICCQNTPSGLISCTPSEIYRRAASCRRISWKCKTLGVKIHGLNGSKGGEGGERGWRGGNSSRTAGCPAKWAPKVSTKLAKIAMGMCGQMAGPMGMNNEQEANKKWLT